MNSQSPENSKNNSISVKLSLCRSIFDSSAADIILPPAPTPAATTPALASETTKRKLVAWSIKNVEKSAAAPLLKEGSFSLHVGDGRKGWPEHAPYDAIHVGAATADVPRDLIDQLKPGGRMVQ
ncbi:hypothetical protein K7X08_024639 [Anisodus acutangulus]|uniref:Protein-L-isoaspartate(D-aspartate) O-methyltransferase n=1 Tax=Anisodus acutangulus TaxID=402998 RepID=A0A9Q1MBI3_9SOLA|nr:hypothetical protein K7X08_024639 [Anisodus acutangulus]